MARTNRYKLTYKQYQFVLAYLTSRDLIAAKAYRSVYTDCKPASSRAAASRLLKNPDVQRYIQYIGIQVFGKPRNWKDPYDE